MAKKRKLNKEDPQEKNQKQQDGAAEQHEESSIQTILDGLTKDQLIDIICDAIADDESLLTDIMRVADKDVAHRKIFVYGLGWDADRDSLRTAFTKYGDIEDCNVVVDRTTGRSKGYGFVFFRHRKGALKALKEPQKRINNRLATCQLAAVGPVGASNPVDVAGRKIYVSNVPADATPEKLRALFAQFGEIESGPGGFDTTTGKCRGYALFLYKTVEAAKKAMQEPYKMFEGHQLHVKKAAEKSNAGLWKPPVAAGPSFLAAVSPSNLALAHTAGAVFPGSIPLVQMVPQAGVGGSLLAATGLAGPVYGIQPPLQQTQSTGLSGAGSSVLGAYTMQGLHGMQLGQGSVTPSNLGAGLPSYTQL